MKTVTIIIDYQDGFNKITSKYENVSDSKIREIQEIMNGNKKGISVEEARRIIREDEMFGY